MNTFLYSDYAMNNSKHKACLIATHFSNAISPLFSCWQTEQKTSYNIIYQLSRHQRVSKSLLVHLLCSFDSEISITSLFILFIKWHLLVYSLSSWTEIPVSSESVLFRLKARGQMLTCLFTACILLSDRCFILPWPSMTYKSPSCCFCFTVLVFYKLSVNMHTDKQVLEQSLTHVTLIFWSLFTSTLKVNN